MLRFLLKRKRIVGLLIVFVFIFGLLGIGKLGKELFPAIDFDQAMVLIETETVPAADVEQFVTIPFEQAMEDLEGVKSYQTSSAIGSSSLMIEMASGEGDDVTKEIQAVVNDISKDLSLVKSTHVMQISTENPYELFLDVTGDSLESMSDFVKNVLEPRLEALPEVRDVEAAGLEEKEIIVELQTEKLQEYGIQQEEVLSYIQQSNLNTSIGKLKKEEGEPAIRWNTMFSDLEDMKQVMIPTDEGMTRLTDIATVTEEISKENQIAWKNGNPDFILVQVGRNSDGATQLDMAQSVRDEVAKIEEEGLTDGVQVNEVVAQADYVDNAITGITDNILIGALIAFVVLLLFLRNIRATIIVGLSIPSTILLTILVMNVFEYSLNIATLIGLGLGIGMMVDASIVVLESIYKKKEQGLRNTEAVIEGTKEVATAVIASMLTTVVVFLPLGILDDDIGMVLFVLAMVIAIALISSVIISFTLIPILAENFLKVKKAKQIRIGIIDKYGNMVDWITKKKRRRISIIGLFVVLFLASFLLLTRIPTSVMPDFFDRYTETLIDLEPGVEPEQREKIALALDKQLEDVPDIEDAIVIDQVDMLVAIINMTPEEEKTAEQSEINEQIMRNFRDLEEEYPIANIVSTLDGDMAVPVQLTISGEEMDKLTEIGNDLAAELEKVDGISTVFVQGNHKAEELRIVLDEEKLEEEGLSTAMLYQQLDGLFAEMPIGELTREGEINPVVLKNDLSIDNRDAFLNYEIATPTGMKPLSAYVSLEKLTSPTQIDREDGERYIQVSAELEGRDLGTVNRDVQEILKQFDVESGYTVALSGDLELQQDAFTDLLIIFGLSLFLVFLVMAVQFNSFRHPLIILSIIPLTITGVLIGLFVTQKDLNLMSGLGVIMLVGIVLNNGILLIDRMKQLRNEGMPVNEAVVTAAKDRIRPIFMTTLTTIGGMIPLSLATGASSGYQSPLAVVIISGLLFSTLITLFLIPAIYLLFEDVGNGLKKLFRKVFRRKVRRDGKRKKQVG